MYLDFQFVDNSGVAEQHRHQWQQIRDYHHKRSSVVVVGAPRYTGSPNDVAAQVTNDCQIHWHDDPNEHNCAIDQTLLGVKLQQRV